MSRFHLDAIDIALLLAAITAISAVVIAPMMLIWRFAHSLGGDLFNKNDLGDFLGLTRMPSESAAEPGFILHQTWPPLAKALQAILSLDMAAIALLTGLALMALASVILEWAPGVLPHRENN